MMRGLVDGSIELTDTAVTAALSLVVYDVTQAASTADSAATTSFVNQALKGVPRSHEIDLLDKYKTVKKEDIIAVVGQYLMPLFDPASSVVVVVTPPGKAHGIREGLTNLGFDVTQKELPIDNIAEVELQDLAGL